MKNTLLFKVALAFSLFIFHFSLAFGQLSGTYTINPSGSGSTNFTSFTNAVNALAKSGISGPVVFNVADGTYMEQLTIHAIKGSSSTNTVTFQSASRDSSKVILTDTSGNNLYSFTIPTLTLDSVGFITFKEITIQQTGALAIAKTLILLNSPKGCSFLNNRIIGQNSANGILINYGDSGNTYKNNLFKCGSYVFVDNWDSIVNYETDLVIENNIIDSFDTYGGYGLLIFNVQNLKISKNTFNSGAYGINIENCIKKINITKNKILCWESGIQTSNCKGTANAPGLICNNTVSHHNVGNYGSGILMSGDSNLLVAYNTVDLWSGGSAIAISNGYTFSYSSYDYFFPYGYQGGGPKQDFEQ